MKLLVTGGTGFLGRHVVWRAASEGAEVIFTGRNADAAAEVMQHAKGTVRWQRGERSLSVSRRSLRATARRLTPRPAPTKSRHHPQRHPPCKKPPATLSAKPPRAECLDQWRDNALGSSSQLLFLVFLISMLIFFVRISRHDDSSGT